MKFIPGYEDLYSATEDGLIFGHKRQKYLKQRLNENGYYRVLLSKNGIKKYTVIHRLIALTYIDNPDNKPFIDHINRIRTDNNVSNLRWATIFENNQNSSIHKDNKLGQQFITYVENQKRFRFDITRNTIHHTKSFKTFEEAIAYRDAYLTIENI